MTTYRYGYYYAIIVLETGKCIEVRDTTNYYDPSEYPEYIPIPEPSMAYILKYYNRADGKWYTDAQFTTLAEGLN